MTSGILDIEGNKILVLGNDIQIEKNNQTVHLLNKCFTLDMGDEQNIEDVFIMVNRFRKCNLCGYINLEYMYIGIEGDIHPKDGYDCGNCAAGMRGTKIVDVDELYKEAHHDKQNPRL